MSASDPLDQFVSRLQDVAAPADLTLVPSVRRASAWRWYVAPLAGTASLAAAYVLFSAPGAAEARTWDQVKQATQRARYRHVRQLGANGEVTGEVWMGPEGVAVVAHDGKRVVSERRSDRRRVYSFFDWFAWRSAPSAPNHLPTGTLQTIGSRTPRAEGPSLDERIETLLANGKGVPMNEKGKDWFRVALPIPFEGHPGYALHLEVRTDDKGRLAESTLSTGQGGGVRGLEQRTLYDYPDSIPAGKFQPRPQARSVFVVDLDVARREIQRRITAPGPERRGVAVRLALLDHEGTLFVFWTGPGIGEAGPGDLRLPGVRTGKARGIWADLAWFRSPAVRRNAPGLGRPLPGRAIVPLQKIGDRVTVSLPGRGGEARFENVPVLRIDDLRYDRDLVGYGAKPPIRSGK